MTYEQRQKSQAECLQTEMRSLLRNFRADG
jgi:hypothetical protein